MAEKEKAYSRLRGKKKGFFCIYTAWLGADHLLLIDSKRISEDYNRFYYSDIQAIQKQRFDSGRSGCAAVRCGGGATET